MSEIYESIMQGLTEALEYAKGNLECRVSRVKIEPVRVFKREEVKSIRASLQMTQSLFAGYMGVSQKTVEAWEIGRNHPSGAASRLLCMLEKDPSIAERFNFASVEHTIDKVSRQATHST